MEIFGQSSAMIEKEEWLSRSVDLFPLSHIVPEKDLSREGDMDSVPGKTPWQNNFRCSYIDSIIYSIIAVEQLLLCSCLRLWRYMTGQSRKNPWPHGASILLGETENKSKDK